MKKFFLLFLIIALAFAKDFHWHDCTKSGSDGHVTSVSMTDLKDGKATLTADFTLNTPITGTKTSGAQWTLIVRYYGMRVWRKVNIPLCHRPKDLGFKSCPIAAGKQTINVQFDVPDAAPPGNYEAELSMDYSENTDHQVFCLKGDFKK
eukprot:TRINITY_DN8993_c0_g1_i1.p1 TRINITY_DN8993_c0_g1~~TRINITY_DN8993_c0_g1_i1.p1  ORF type:complete len:164 (+),score=28.93 TRINITY_DN8993_c0_g1_i1:46-492(+)